MFPRLGGVAWDLAPPTPLCAEIWSDLGLHGSRVCLCSCIEFPCAPALLWPADTLRYIHTLPLALQRFCFFFLKELRALGGGPRCIFPFKAGHFCRAGFCAVASCGSVCLLSPTANRFFPYLDLSPDNTILLFLLVFHSLYLIHRCYTCCYY